MKRMNKNLFPGYSYLDVSGGSLNPSLTMNKKLDDMRAILQERGIAQDKMLGELRTLRRRVEELEDQWRRETDNAHG